MAPEAACSAAQDAGSCPQPGRPARPRPQRSRRPPPGCASRPASTSAGTAKGYPIHATPTPPAPRRFPAHGARVWLLHAGRWHHQKHRLDAIGRWDVSPRRTGHQDHPGSGGAGGASCPAVKGECPAPAAAQVEARRPFTLDGLPGTTARAGHRRWQGGDAPSARAASLASSAALPVLAHSPRWPRRSTPYAGPYAGHPRTSPPAWSAVAAGDAPSGEWSGQAARCASRD